MPSKMHSGKPVWIVAAAVGIILLILITLFVSNNTPSGQESIVLPSAPVDSSQESTQGNTEQYVDSNDFITITNKNVATVLQTLDRPTAYHQSYTVTVGSERRQRTKSVELWVNRKLLHAEILDGQQTMSVVTDGQTLYLWYDNSSQYIALELVQGMTIEDVLGLPDFDAHLKISPNMVTEAEYLLLEEPQIQCIYVSTKDADNVQSRYWVNLENGLLYQADALENNERVYDILQTEFSLLSVEDESFSDRFILPDGTVPFIAETKIQQP